MKMSSPLSVEIGEGKILLAADDKVVSLSFSEALVAGRMLVAASKTVRETLVRYPFRPAKNALD